MRGSGGITCRSCPEVEVLGDQHAESRVFSAPVRVHLPELNECMPSLTWARGKQYVGNLFGSNRHLSPVPASWPGTAAGRCESNRADARRICTATGGYSCERVSVARPAAWKASPRSLTGAAWAESTEGSTRPRDTWPPTRIFDPESSHEDDVRNFVPGHVDEKKCHRLVGGFPCDGVTLLAGGVAVPTFYFQSSLT